MNSITSLIEKRLPMILFTISISLCTIPQILNVSISVDNCKYLFFLLMFISSSSYIYKKNVTLKLKKECCYILTLILLICFVSLLSAFSKKIYSFRLFLELTFLLIPVLSAFFMINIYNEDELYIYIKFLFIFCFLLYGLELTNRGVNLLSIFQINFFDSFSPFESYLFADLSFFFFCFFCYFRKKWSDDKINLYYYTSFLFVLFTFKRILVLAAIILFILSYFNSFEIEVRKKEINIIILLFFVFTLFYTWLLQGDNALFLKQLLSFDFDKFTVGRKWYFSVIENNMQYVAGYGTTTDILTRSLGIGKYLEMDLVKILVETGPIVLMAFIYVYWQQIKPNFFSVLVLLFLFVNLLFSHSLTTYYGWSLFLLMFYMIKNYKEDR